MRIRLHVALALCIAAGGFLYLGFADLKLPHDKAIHFGAFLLMTTLFYWTLDLPRRRLITTTFLVCTLFGSTASEFAQGYLAKNRQFDPNDIAANISGSLIALGLCAFYHRRLLERRRQARYQRIRSNLSELEAQVESTEFELNSVSSEEHLPIQRSGTSTPAPPPGVPSLDTPK